MSIILYAVCFSILRSVEILFYKIIFFYFFPILKIELLGQIPAWAPSDSKEWNRIRSPAEGVYIILPHFLTAMNVVITGDSIAQG